MQSASLQVQKLQGILKPMMLRRLKEDVEKNLAPKEETIIEVELTNIQKKYYRAILEKNFAFLSKGGAGGGGGNANVPNLLNTMMELRKCCNHPYLINGKSPGSPGHECEEPQSHLSPAVLYPLTPVHNCHLKMYVVYKVCEIRAVWSLTPWPCPSSCFALGCSPF